MVDQSRDTKTLPPGLRKLAFGTRSHRRFLTSWVLACCFEPPAPKRCLTLSLSSHAKVSRSACFRRPQGLGYGFWPSLSVCYILHGAPSSEPYFSAHTDFQRYLLPPAATLMRMKFLDEKIFLSQAICMHG
jgi:hypothetical protein